MEEIPVIKDFDGDTVQFRNLRSIHGNIDPVKPSLLQFLKNIIRRNITVPTIGDSKHNVYYIKCNCEPIIENHLLSLYNLMVIVNNYTKIKREKYSVELSENKHFVKINHLNMFYLEQIFFKYSEKIIIKFKLEHEVSARSIADWVNDYDLISLSARPENITVLDIYIEGV